MHYNFFIVNKIGLLIYDKKFPGSAVLDSSDLIRYGATLSALHLLTAIVTPPGQKKSGFKFINSKSFKLCCYQTQTGVKFCLVSDPNTMDMEKLCKQAYQHYSDFVLKNPFYELEQQIRFEGYDRAIDKLFGPR
jgi:trafficking protein particle complex subunit 4